MANDNDKAFDDDKPSPTLGPKLFNCSTVQLFNCSTVQLLCSTCSWDTFSFVLPRFPLDLEIALTFCHSHFYFIGHTQRKKKVLKIFIKLKPKADFFKIQLNFTSIYKSQIWNNFFEGLSEWNREKNNCLQSSSINYRWAIFTFGVKINNGLALERSQ